MIRQGGPRRGIEDVELATLEWVSWYNGQQLLQPLGYLTPAEFEAMYYQTQQTPVTMAGVN